MSSLILFVRALPEGVHHCKSLDDAMNDVNNETTRIHRVFIIGGASIYQVSTLSTVSDLDDNINPI